MLWQRFDLAFVFYAFFFAIGNSKVCNFVILSFSDLTPVVNHFSTIVLKSLEQNFGFAFGLKSLCCTVFPSSCTSFYGPHSRQCLVHFWLEGGCLLTGYRAPENMSEVEYDIVWKDLTFE